MAAAATMSRRSGHRRYFKHREQATAHEAGEESETQVGSQYLKPTLKEIIQAVESLYQDQLKPFGRILRKRIAEHASGAALDKLYVCPGGTSKPLPNINVNHLRVACDACSFLHVSTEVGGDWSVIFTGRPMNFVDIYSPHDVYPPDLWTQAQAYFQSLAGAQMYLPGGRYACAQVLLGRRLGFFAGRTLGQVCHVVQLAISHRRILGYSSGAIVPYGSSQSMAKDQCAVQQQPCMGIGVTGHAGPDGSQGLPLATLEVARKYLQEILHEAGGGQGSAVVPLSNIKRLFRSRYSTELSETMLGHSRLSDLLQGEHFNDLCTLRLQKNGWIVTQKRPSPAKGAAISLADSIPLGGGGTNDAVISLANTLPLGTAPESQQIPSRQALLLDMHLGDSQTFEQQQQQQQVLGSLDPPVAPSIPLPVHAHLAAPIGHLPLSAPCAQQPWLDNPGRVEFCPNEPLCFDDFVTEGADKQSLVSLEAPTPLPSPGVPGSATVRRWGGATTQLLEFFPEGEVEFFREAEDCPQAAEPPPAPLTLPLTAAPAAHEDWTASAHPGAGQSCPDEPLSWDGAASPSDNVLRSPLLFSVPTPEASPGVPGSVTVRKWGQPHRLVFFPDEEDVGTETRTTVQSPRPSVSTHTPGSPSAWLRTIAPTVTRSPGETAMLTPRWTTSFSATRGADTCKSRLSFQAFDCAMPRSLSLPKDLGSHTPEARPRSDRGVADSLSAPRLQLFPVTDMESPQGDCTPGIKCRRHHAGPEPLALDDVGDATPRWLMLSPKDKSVQLTVRHTFLHSASSLSPASSMEARRSRSMPPNTQTRRSLSEVWGGSSGSCCESPHATGLPAFVPASHISESASRSQRIVCLADHV